MILWKVNPLDSSQRTTLSSFLTCCMLGLLSVASTYYFSINGTVFSLADLTLQLRWIRDFADGYSAGWLYPRWSQTAYQGFGEPSFLFLHPAYYFVSSLLYNLVSDPVRVVQILALTTIWLETALMFLFLRKQIGYPYALMLSMAVLSWPFHHYMLNNAQMLPFQFALVPLMLLLFAIDRLLLGGRGHWACCVATVGFSMAFLILSHVLLAFTVIVSVSAVVACLSLLHRDRALLLRWIGATAVGGLLSSIYLIPALGLLGEINPAGWEFEPEGPRWNGSFMFPTWTLLSGDGTYWTGLTWFLPSFGLVVLAAAILLARLSRTMAGGSRAFWPLLRFYWGPT